MLEEACCTCSSEEDDCNSENETHVALLAAVIPGDQLPLPAAIPFGHAAPLTRAEEDRHRIVKMEEWLATVAARPDGGPEAVAMHGVELRATEGCGVGVFAAEAGTGLGVGHVALKLGRDCILSHQRALDGCVAYYDIASILEAVRCPPTTAVALFLVARRALDLSPGRATQHQAALTEVAAHADTATSVGSPPGLLDRWVATLPGYSRLECAVPSLCTPTQPGGTRPDAVQAVEDKLRRQVAAVLSYVEDEIRGRAAFVPFFPREVFSEAALTWALGLIYSRGFDCGIGATTMLPMIDMVNHAAEGTHECNCRRCFDHSGAVVVMTSRAIAPGEELRHTYAPEAARCRSFGDQMEDDEQLQAELTVKYGVPPK
eukprot:COSAG02_NODE_4619_length_5156_cov_4.440577_1_plen_374_part_00